MAVAALAQQDFQKEVLEHKGKVFVDFHAEWCAPCKITSPVIEELSQEMKDIKFVKVDVDQNPELASQYSVFSIPTFLILQDGKVVNQFVGAMGKEGFLEQIKKASS